MRKVSVLLLVIVAGLPAADGRYDLGGPCKDLASAAEVRAPRKTQRDGSWEEAIAWQKAHVRAACGNQYRWYQLAGALLEARRPAEAVQVLEEMDARGFDLNPALAAKMHPGVAKFMESAVFRSSATGARIAQLEKAADERRARYREALSKLPPGQKPPDRYIAKNACPFECCRYGMWTVRKDTELVAAPGSSRVIGTVKKDGRVTALTGEVHLKPEPVVVLMDIDAMPKNSIAFVLDYMGEGFGHVYTRGKVIDVFLGVERYCLRVSESCWGESLSPSGEHRAPVWWIKVRLSNGVTGWTDKADHFGDNDACG